MKYFIRLRWWRDCHFYPQRWQNLTIAENPQDYLKRQRARLGDEWTGIEIVSCCPVADDAEVSADPDLGPRSKRWDEMTPEEQAASNRAAKFALAGFAALVVFVIGLMAYGC